MNAIAKPENLSLVYLNSEQLTYQYVDGDWVPHSYDSYQNTIDFLLTLVTEIGNIEDSCCGINISSTNVRYAIGDTLDCGVIFYISPSWSLLGLKNHSMKIYIELSVKQVPKCVCKRV